MVPRLPYQPPAWFTSERVVTAAGMLGAFGACGTGIIIDLPLPGRLLVGLGAMLYAALVIRFALKPADPGLGLVRLFLGAVSAAGLGLLFPPGVPFCTFSAVPTPASLALFFWAGVGLTPLVVIVFVSRRRPSHDVPVRVLRATGATLVALGTIALAIVAAPHRPPFIAIIAVGGVMAAGALVWLGLRARFIRRLRAGKATLPLSARDEAQAPPALPLAPAGAQPYLDEGLLPYRLGGLDAAYELLVWNPPPGDASAYRDRAQPVPLALVPVPNQRRRTADDWPSW
jgi:hypothetical protein